MSSCDGNRTGASSLFPTSTLLCVGAAFATTSWITILVALVVVCTAYVYRIQAEEQMLLSTSRKEYLQYQAHTLKLVSYIY